MKTKSKVHAVIPAAGRGVRFGSATNKIFSKLVDRAIIEWTVDAFRLTADQITLIAGADDMDKLEKFIDQEKVRIVLGGTTRQESVWNGLQTVEGEDTIVLVHDAARPLVSSDLIARCINSAEMYGSGVAAVRIVDALKSSLGIRPERQTVTADVSREGVWAAQTPQAFTASLLRQAHQKAADDGYWGVDESSLVQRLPGFEVHLVDGDRRNIKITTADDLEFATLMAPKNTTMENRIGIGYDIHRLVVGRPLWLGGVLIPSELGLDGHSDADVVIHAICDSLLGAAALPDIGHLFPNTDERYRNISSLKLLAAVQTSLEETGWRVGNIDTMLIAEQPRIAPYISAMKDAICGVLGTSSNQVSIKATTNEGIGSLGAGDGIACHATSCIIRSMLSARTS